MNKRKCPLCGEANNKQVYKAQLPVDHGLLGKSICIVQCQKCKFLYNDILVSREILANHYKYCSVYQKAGTIQYFNQDYVNIADYLSKFIVDKNTNILDLGCSQGKLLLQLQKRGFDNLTGVQLSESNCEWLTKNNIIAINSDIFEISSNKKYDLIILSQVLQHIMDIQLLMTKICDLLSDQGILYISVPPVNYYSFHNNRVPFHLFFPQHINHFSLHSINILLMKFDFKLISADFSQFQVVQNSFSPTMRILSTKNQNYFLKSLNSYINNETIKYNKYLLQIDTKLKLTGSKDVIVYGIGVNFQRLSQSLSQMGYSIVLCVDDNPNKVGTIISGMKIFDSKELFNVEKSTPIVISTYGYNNEISNRLTNLGIKNPQVVV